MREFDSEIYAAVSRRALRQPINAGMVKVACPGWADKTYHAFLAKHAVENGKTTELFIRVRRGFYRLNKPTPTV